MKRRSFLALLGVAPVAAEAAPAVASAIPTLTIEEMEERYFRPYAEEVHKEMLRFNENSFAMCIPPLRMDVAIGTGKLS